MSSVGQGQEDAEVTQARKKGLAGCRKNKGLDHDATWLPKRV